MNQRDKVHKVSREWFKASKHKRNKWQLISPPDNPCQYDAFAVSWCWKTVTCKKCLKTQPKDEEQNDGQVL